MDPLSDLLLAIRVMTTAIGVFDLGPGTGIAIPSMGSGAVLCHMVIEGPLWMQVEREPPVLLNPLDALLILDGHPVNLLTSLDAPLQPLDHIMARRGIRPLRLDDAPAAPIMVNEGSGMPRTRLFGLHYLLQAMPHEISFKSLPPVIVIRHTATAGLPWAPASLEMLAVEAASAAPGFLASATKWAELMLTSLLRAYALQHTADGANWLRATSDPRIAKALALIHARPSHPWRVSDLAKAAGMGRSTFAARFLELAGCSPIEYLIDVRMQRAAERLLHGGARIGALAEEFGYRSERAFRHAFRERFGVAPTRYTEALRRSI